MTIKENYQHKLETQLDEWSIQIDKLKAKASKVEAESQLEYYKQIEKLRELQQLASKKLAELKAANDNAWEDLKAGVDSVWDSFGAALKSATSRFK
ncbi:hypothetical protein [Rheinheimera sp. UJ63]|uniref:hypothetical protein n=1 Tax=Rheinheimera sp. UJ63 TaxID=2910157 RepID=UPI001F43ECEE|nr:hypothetical protein [Rheinheimera sp. UJ63]MCF4007857.1 hypothetical protein [Rheinheimera sp. UJ63]